MLKRKLSLIIVAALMVNISATPLTAIAQTINNKETIEEFQQSTLNEAKVSKFDTYYSSYREAYDNKFKMKNSNIESIIVNGNHRNNSVKENMIDGDLNTYWETAKNNSDNFTNEIIFNLNEETELNRIAYRSAWNTVGFAEKFRSN